MSSTSLVSSPYDKPAYVWQPEYPPFVWEPDHNVASTDPRINTHDGGLLTGQPSTIGMSAEVVPPLIMELPSSYSGQLDPADATTSESSTMMATPTAPPIGTQSAIHPLDPMQVQNCCNYFAWFAHDTSNVTMPVSGAATTAVAPLTTDQAMNMPCPLAGISLTDMMNMDPMLLGTYVTIAGMPQETIGMNPEQFQTWLQACSDEWVRISTGGNVDDGEIIIDTVGN